MVKFIKLMLGTNGEISSKRCMMIFFALLFAYALISNHLTGMNVDDTMKWQLFFLLLWAMSIVFGEKIPEIISVWTGKKTTTTTEVKIEQKKDADPK